MSGSKLEPFSKDTFLPIADSSKKGSCQLLTDERVYTLGVGWEKPAQ